MHMITYACSNHYNDVIMSAMASHITSLKIVYWTVYSGADQIKHQSSASLALVWGIHRWPVNSPHKGPVTRKTFLFDDVIMTERPCWPCWLYSARSCRSSWSSLISFCSRVWRRMRATVEVWSPPGSASDANRSRTSSGNTSPRIISYDKKVQSNL